MKYIWKNIYLFWKYDKKIFNLCIFSTFFSMLIMLTAYGIYGDYTRKQISSETDLNSVDIDIISSEEKPLTKEIFTNAILACPDDLLNKIDMFLVAVDVSDGYFLELRFAVQDGVVGSCEVFGKNLKTNGMIEDYFTSAQEIQGEHVAFVYKGDDMQLTEIAASFMNEDNGVTILEDEYTVIGTQSWASPVLIPYQALRNDTQLSASQGIELYFHSPVIKKDYDLLKETLLENLQGYIKFPTREIPDFNKMYLYNSILIVLLFVIFASAINFGLLYKYVLIKRRKTLSVFQLCGLTAGKAAGIYIGECIGLLLVTVPLALLAFRWVVYPGLSGVYEDIGEFYSLSIYLGFGVAYMIGSLIIFTVMILMEIKKGYISMSVSEEGV